MYRRMLIALDGTEASANVLTQALVLARSEGAAVDIVTVVPGYQGDLRIMGDTRVLRDMQARYQVALDSAKETALARGVRARAFLRHGDPAEEIVSVAEETGADLLAMGKRSRLLLDTMPIGLVANEVIAQSETDVLVVPAGKTLGLERLFLAYDGSDGAEKAARQACALAARYGAHLTVGLAYEMELEAFALEPKLEKALHGKALRLAQPALDMARRMDVRQVEVAVRHGNPIYKALTEEAAARGAGLLVAGYGGRRGLSRMVMGSVATRLVILSTSPVLIVKV